MGAKMPTCMTRKQVPEASSSHCLSSNSYYGWQLLHWLRCTWHAGSERTFSTLQEAAGKAAAVAAHEAAGTDHQLQAAESPRMSVVYQGTQQSNQRGTKRKASCAEDPIYQRLGTPKPASRLRLQKSQRRH